MKIKNKARIILKAILFYTTIILLTMYISCIDSLFDKSFILEPTITVAGLISLCYLNINKKELDIILFTKYIFKYLDENNVSKLD
jgi:hypothetical protein